MTLTYCDKNQPVILQTDTSEYGAGTGPSRVAGPSPLPVRY